MNDQHDDPLRSSVPLISSSEGIASPRSVASTSAPFMKQANVTSSSKSGPRSAYYNGPPGKDSAFNTPPVGVIGRDKPREIVR